MPNDENDQVIDRRAIAHGVESCAASHRALDEHLGSLSGIDPSAPSRLPGWTLGHVLTHIARNGDSHLDMLAGRPQYPGVAERNADIEAGLARPWPDLVEDVRRASAAVDEAFRVFERWDGPAATLGGDRPAGMLPLLRQREVEIHRVDLGLGYGFDDLPGDYVRRESRVLEMLWTARQPMGLTRLPSAALERTSHERLAWLFGRAEIDGVDPAAIF